MVAQARKGSVALEAAICLMSGFVFLVGASDIILELRNWFRVNALASHVAQTLAQTDNLSSAVVASVMSSALDAQKSLLPDGGIIVKIVSLSESNAGSVVLEEEVGDSCAEESIASIPVDQLSSFSSAGGKIIVDVAACTPAAPWPINLNGLFGNIQAPALYGYAVLGSSSSVSS